METVKIALFVARPLAGGKDRRPREHRQPMGDDAGILADLQNEVGSSPRWSFLPLPLLEEELFQWAIAEFRHQRIPVGG